jgi:hypothetical protein
VVVERSPGAGASEAFPAMTQKSVFIGGDLWLTPFHA